MAGTECLMTKFGGHYDNSATVSCVPQPPDTVCGNVGDWFDLVPGQGFKVQPDGTTVFFECYGKSSVYSVYNFISRFCYSVFEP